MVSAAGSGELLFTPRVGALYGYALLWALLAAVALKWFINREIGRYTVCTGRTLLQGFEALPGPRGWALWLIVVPQLVVAVATIAGLGGSAATALVLALPGDVRLWTIGSVLISTALVLVGKYRGVEVVAMTLAVALALASLAAAFSVFPDPGEVAAGLRPQVPAGVDYADVLPWLGFMLSGAAGMIWYSYWAQAKGYGAAGGSGQPPRVEDARRLAPDDRARLRGWLAQMTLDNSVAVGGTLLITLAFLVLGVELLRPQGLVPEENRIAEVLGELLGGVWGRIGFWFMVLAVFVGFWDTVLSNQDGFGRMFADGINRMRGGAGSGATWSHERLHTGIVVVVLTAAPVALYLVAGEPVRLLQVAGAIEAAHIPVVATLTLVVNHRELPRDLRASTPVAACTALAALFFAAFASAYVFTL
jgi:Mn2+/Fe2+ NRAMP family transporter